MYIFRKINVHHIFITNFKMLLVDWSKKELNYKFKFEVIATYHVLLVVKMPITSFIFL